LAAVQLASLLTALPELSMQITARVCCDSAAPHSAGQLAGDQVPSCQEVPVAQVPLESVLQWLPVHLPELLTHVSVVQPVGSAHVHVAVESGAAASAISTTQLVKLEKLNTISLLLERA
jgi:hypothetical protein